MIKNMYKILIVCLLVLGIVNSDLYAYSDELFEFDIPDTYGNISYSGLTMFASTEKTERIIILLSREQKYSSISSVWELSDSDVDKIVSELGSEYNVMHTDKRARLGKEKAIKLRVTTDGACIEGYLLMTKGYIHFVGFGASSLADLENDDFKMVKDSFKLKGSSNTAQNIFIIAVIAIVGTMLFLYIKEKSKKNDNIYYTNTETNSNNLNDYNYINNSNDDNFNNQ